MQLLKDTILKKGYIKEDNILKVDSFLNHQLEIPLLDEIGKEFKRRFESKNVTKILTIESSGIAIAALAAKHFNVPVVFAKKTKSKNLDGNTYKTKVYSFTKDKEYTVQVSKKYLSKKDNVLVLDDFLAKGKASLGLIDILNKAQANLAGVGIVIEKGFQEGGKKLRKQGIHLESLAIVKDFKKGKINFRN